MRVISSPSISTTGFLTLIFAIANEPLHAHMFEWKRGRMPWARPYGAAGSILQGQNTRAKHKTRHGQSLTHARPRIVREE
jgi:hypothetical protein